MGANVIRLLEGVRVVECAVLFNGDQTGRLLGDLGADVIKVEAPGVGDYLRDFLGQLSPHHSPAHVFANRNKRSITLDLRSDDGRFDLDDVGAEIAEQTAGLVTVEQHRALHDADPFEQSDHVGPLCVDTFDRQ